MIASISAGSISPKMPLISLRVASAAALESGFGIDASSVKRLRLS
jgi:hypothetical protein